MIVFVISWANQHEKANLISNTISNAGFKVFIVYSDPNPDFIFTNATCEIIRRPNELFWEDKFKTCIEAANNSGILVIHADCHCEDWALLVKRCAEVNLNSKDIGVWSPQITGSPYELNVSGILKIKKTQLVLSARTDGIVFYLSPSIVRRMQRVSFGKNKYGWGIASLFCATSHVQNKLIIIDTAIKVFHPLGKRGYDGSAAQLLKNDFINQFSIRERLMYELFQSHVLYNRSKISDRTKAS